LNNKLSLAGHGDFQSNLLLEKRFLVLNGTLRRKLKKALKSFQRGAGTATTSGKARSLSARASCETAAYLVMHHRANLEEGQKGAA
jgi:hypothetical protein